MKRLNDSFVLYNYIVEDITTKLSEIAGISKEEAMKRVEKILQCIFKRKKEEEKKK